MSVNDDHVLVEDGVGVPHGIALDWINSNLYWTNEALRTVSVLSLTTHQKITLFDTRINNAQDIVVDPRSNEK